MIHFVLIAQLAANAATTPGAAGHQLILAADISPSQESEVLRSHAELASALVSRLSFGDRLVLLQVREKGVSAADRGRSLTAPHPKNPRRILASDRRQLTAFHKTALQMTKEVIDPDKSAALTNTDLLATLQLAGQHVQDRGARKPVLVIMSDMLQTVGSFNFEREPPPTSEWIRRQKAGGLIPDLRGACVIIVGADVTTQRALQIKKFWEEYLRAANARVEQYRMIAADPSALGCGL